MFNRPRRPYILKMDVIHQPIMKLQFLSSGECSRCQRYHFATGAIESQLTDEDRPLAKCPTCPAVLCKYSCFAEHELAGCENDSEVLENLF